MKKTILAFGIVTLVIVSSAIVYVVLDGLDFFDQEVEPLVQDVPKEEELDPIAIKVTELMNQVDESMMQEYIEKLSSWGPHPTALYLPYKLSNRPIIGRFFDLPIEKVANYIYTEFESMGLDVRYQHWEVERTKENLRALNSKRRGWHVGDNIEATIPGKDKSSDEIYLAVAHYDTVPKAPGADDDSSGVAAMLCAAKLMSQYSFNHTIRFVAVSGEEQLLLGSHAYVEEAVKNNDNIVATLCIDMIGNRGPAYREPEVLLISGYEDEGSLWISDFVTDVNQRYPEHLNFTVRYDEQEGYSHYSDFIEFVDDGYNALFIAEATMSPHRHKETDTIENMDVPYATKVAKLALATLAEMAWDVECK